MRILLIEDDSSLGNTIKRWLELDGYAIDWIKNGNEVERTLETQNYDCLLLDRGLPGLSGDEVLMRLRLQHDQVPIIMITALDSVMNRIEGLDLGADDYLVKPFDLEELSARIRVAIRRSSGIASPILQHESVTLDPRTKKVALNGEDISLTAKEFMVLYVLMQNPKQVMTRTQLEDKLYSWGEEIESNAVEVHIHHLRKKLGNTFIRTIRNLGYTLSNEQSS